jgi:hypothetical protein
MRAVGERTRRGACLYPWSAAALKKRVAISAEAEKRGKRPAIGRPGFRALGPKRRGATRLRSPDAEGFLRLGRVSALPACHGGNETHPRFPIGFTNAGVLPFDHRSHGLLTSNRATGTIDPFGTVRSPASAKPRPANIWLEGMSASVRPGRTRLPCGPGPSPPTSWVGRVERWAKDRGGFGGGDKLVESLNASASSPIDRVLVHPRVEPRFLGRGTSLISSREARGICSVVFREADSDHLR